jgi:hypothetical protein
LELVGSLAFTDKPRVRLSVAVFSFTAVEIV